MRGESEAISASRIRDRVVPQFNSEVDKEFAKMNPDVDARLASLRELKLYPDAKSWSTTDQRAQGLDPADGAHRAGGQRTEPGDVSRTWFDDLVARHV